MKTPVKKKTLNMTAWIAQYCHWLERHYVAVIWLSLATAILGGVYSTKLYKNLRTDMEELLPATAQSVKDIKAVTGRVGGLNHISVVIESSNVEAGRRLQKDFAAKLRELPTDLVAKVQETIKTERDFFSTNKSLYIDTSDWQGILDYVRDRIHYERRAKNPFSLGLDDDKKPKVEKPEFDFEGLKKKYADRTSSYARFPDGYFESRDGHTHIVLAFLPGKVTDIASSKRLSEVAHEIALKLNPKSYAPDMVVGFDGDVQNLVEEHHGLIEDLEKSFIICTLLVGMVLMIYFRSFIGVYALCASLFAGVAWTFGMSYAVVGYLNANTAFLGSIVVGNGINFGVIMLARYLEERRRGLDGRDALPRSIAFTAQATSTAAIAAGLSYMSLMLTDFRGFSQFGIIGGLGMFFCWLSSFITLPALLIWIEHRGWLRPRVGEARPVVARFVSRMVIQFHKPLVALTLVSVLASGLLVTRLSKDTLESDFSKLRNKDSILHGSGFWGKKVDLVFERYLTPTVLLTRDPKDSAKLVEALQAIQKREGDSSPISEIQRVEDFLPTDQIRKIKIIEEVKSKLPPKVMARLSESDRKLVADLLPDHALKPLELSDLPEGLTYHFREIDGTIGHLVHVYPKLLGGARAQGTSNEENGGFWDGKEVIRFAEHLREAERVAGVSAAIAGQPPLSADMISAISNDGPKATAAAFLAVMVLILILFPKWELSRSVLGALVLGVLWLGGLMGAFNLKINFLNFIALPITFGIGVDYAVNIFSRYRLDGARSISGVIESTGGAVALCSATTIIGYSSLLLAGSQAFVSFGTLAVLGELTCLTAAIIALPAILHFFESEEETIEDAVPTAKG